MAGVEERIDDRISKKTFTMGVPSSATTHRAPSEYMRKGHGLEKLEERIEKTHKERKVKVIEGAISAKYDAAMGLVPGKRFSNQRGVSGVQSRSNVEYQDYEDHETGYHSRKHDGSVNPIAEEDEESYREEQPTKLPPIKPSKASIRASSMKTSKKSRKTLAPHGERDTSAETGNKRGVSRSPDNRDHLERNPSAKLQEKEKPDSNVSKRGISASQLDRVTNLNEVRDTESSRKLPGITVRDAPTSGMTKMSKKSSRKPTDPNGFEKWFQKNKNSGV